MDARTLAQALGAFRASRTRVLACVTRTPNLLMDRRLNRLLLPPAQPFIRLRGQHDLALAVYWQYVAVSQGDRHGPWRVEQTRYEYLLLNAERREILSHHWHPQVSGSVAFPHLHVRSDASPLSHKTHVPTGFVTLGAVVRLLIAEFGVPPLRDDWERVVGDG